MPLPPATLGRLIENRVIELLIALSGGRLVVYRPESDFEGTDLHVALRHQTAELRIQVKGRAYHEPDGSIQAEAEVQDIPEGDPKYLVVVEYFPDRAALGSFLWIIHSAEFRRLGRRSGKKWRAQLSPSPTARDKWVDFRFNVGDLPWVVETLLKASLRGEPLPAAPTEVRAQFSRTKAKESRAPARARRSPRKQRSR